jgi:hypothetical protein
VKQMTDPMTLRGARLIGTALLVGALTAACTTAPEERAVRERESPRPSASSTEATPAPTPPAADPVIGPVPAEQWEAMVAAGMVRPGCPVQRRSQLRRVDVGYIDFEGDAQRGHLIVNRDTARSVARIFTVLFDQRFPIASMTSVETFGGDTNVSLRANNTSAFNCRRLDQINAPPLESPHANGRAVDINPRQNPWMDLRCNCWVPDKRDSARTPGPGKIVPDDAVVRLFEAEGWIWQNIKVPDYMHFDTGYPSAPYERPGTAPAS